ncbi:histidinol-phosphate transaminase [Desulfonatronovibrio hydrogenovorans]|uniref:histidinol-phosphate transaminase n=1 Tax=Desulfonatronovibrio hydrogenovorans TaxID=53245 RepID=UPI00048E35E1|nr:histidinol-phosphate transaminase [Desulfonatronovibrio hydrogenovorans]
MNKPSPRLVQPQILEFKPYSPGLGIDEIKEKFELDNVVKMASNENPLGVSPIVQDVITANAALAFRYPAAGNPALTRAISSYLGIDPELVVCGNGSDEIIDLLIRMTAVPGRDNIAAFRPCFSIYELQSRLCNVEFRQADLNPDFSFNWEGLLSMVDSNTRLVFLTNPDNPSGFAVSGSEIQAFARCLPDDALLVVDEAYIDFADPVEKFSILRQALGSHRIVLLRTFSKMFGLAGLRLGYAVMPAFLADYYRRVRLPFSVNILAEKAGQAALEDTHFRDATRDLVIKARQSLSEGLSSLGCQVYPSQANFIMFKPPVSATEVFEKLLQKGVIIRPLKSYGLPDLLRVSIGTEKENALFLELLKAIVNEG